MSTHRLRVLLEISLTLALAVVLGTLKLWQMPQGGSVSLGMLPIFVLALRRGPLVGTAAGALSGVLALIVEPPFIVHPIQFLLDYPLASAAVGLAGVTASVWHRSVTKSKGTGGRYASVVRGLYMAVIPGIALGSILRYVLHVISGVVYFAEYAEGQPVLAYSAAYNSYVLVSAVLCAVAACLIMPTLERVVRSHEE